MAISKKRILLYVEGGLYLGLGNVYRMISLLDFFKQKEDIEARFITTSDEYVADLISEHGYEVLRVAKEKLGAQLIKSVFDLLIVDKLNVDPLLIKEVKDHHFCKIVLFGNLNPANQFADLVVNAVLGGDTTNKRITEGERLTLSGPKYLILRDEFRFRVYQQRGELRKVLLQFGGTDQANLSKRVLQVLLTSSRSLEITVVVGAGYPFIDTLEPFLDNPCVRLLKNVKNLSSLMLAHDMLITSAGTTLFEAFYQGVPSIAFFQNEAQKEVFGQFYLTSSFDESIDLIGRMEDLYSHYDLFLKKLDELEVGEGKEEITNELKKLLL